MPVPGLTVAVVIPLGRPGRRRGIKRRLTSGGLRRAWDGPATARKAVVDTREERRLTSCPPTDFVAAATGSESLDHEAYLPTEPAPAQAQARLSLADEDERRTCGAEAPARQGPQAPNRLGRLEIAMGMPTGRFKRSDRLLQSRDYRRVSSEGRRAASACFVLIAAPGLPEGEARRRLGITASRKVGDAVRRNGVKRRVREWFRRGRTGLPEGSDWVVIARRDAVSLDGAETARELDQLARRLVARFGEPSQGPATRPAAQRSSA